MIDTVALREKVLDLAIRGKLVPQDPNDEPASVLLERIREQKQQMVKEGKLKAKDIKDDSVIFVGEDNLHYEKFADGTVKCIEDEIPFELPEGWAWCRISNIAQVLNGDRGKNYPAKNKLQKDGIPFVSALNIEHGTISKEKLLCLTEEQYNLLGAGKLIYNDIVYCIRGSLGKCGIYPYDIGAIASSLVIVRSILREDSIIKYIYNYLCTELSKDEIGKYDSGSAQPNLAAKDFLKFFIPLPPLSEMGEILDRIDKSLNLIDSIGKNKDEAKELVSVLKTKILDLAIRGKLVPQDPNDEPASVLLERIRAEKEELIKQGKIKRDKKESIIFKGDDNSYYEKIGNSAVCIDHKLPFTLPDGWTWCVLPEIAKIVMGSSPDGATINNSNEGIEFHQGKIFFTSKMLNPSDKSTTQPSKIAPKDSVLLCVRAPVGELNITDRSVCIGRGLSSIHPYHYIDAEWLFYWLQTYKGYLNMKATGSTFVAITADIVKTILIPLPPLKEQEEILKTINKVFFIVDLIEKSLR